MPGLVPLEPLCDGVDNELFELSLRVVVSTDETSVRELEINV